MTSPIWTHKATDAGSPPLSSAARLDIEWTSPEPPSAEPIAFDEPHFTFAVMETEPVTHMVGIIMTETYRLRWFHIVGKILVPVHLVWTCSWGADLLEVLVVWQRIEFCSET